MAASHGKSWILSNRFAKSSDNPIEPQGERKRRLWGRRMTRPLGKDRARAFETWTKRVAISKDVLNTPINPDQILPNYKEHWLEIGFGGGEHLIALMDKHPHVGFLGAEPFINGISSFYLHLQNRHPGASRDFPGINQEDSGVRRNDENVNVRVFDDDAMLLVEKLADESIERIYILNPDPWPKNRHHKRRIVRAENIQEFHRILKPGGLLLTCTDVDPLAEWMVRELSNFKGLKWTAESPKDWQTPSDHWASTTRYREKGVKAGRKQTYLIFKKACK